MPKVQYITVTSQESGQKLLQFLQRRLQGGVPRSAIMRWIRKGQVRIDKSRSQPFHRITTGQIIRVPPYYDETCPSLINEPSDNPFQLGKVYEDESILVVSKPPNLPTQPGSKQIDSVHDRVQRGYVYADWKPALVHRLDKDVSGLLLLAKSYEYLQHLQAIWLQGRIRKIYLAWVEGKTFWYDWSKLIDTLSVKDRKNSLGKRIKAVSWVKTLRNQEDKSLVAICLQTGRKHQIRIQLSKRDHWIIGDKKYGRLSSAQGILLHAGHLAWDEFAFTLRPYWHGGYAVEDSDFQAANICPPFTKER
ncbi:MAG TPA: RluA family pseudouridine synthase [Desulfohalobiaceae bacterium]|nr:RluA family pseudouridine synthase [Desulfohalobiaceae bacterium]